MLKYEKLVRIFQINPKIIKNGFFYPTCVLFIHLTTTYFNRDRDCDHVDSFKALASHRLYVIRTPEQYITSWCVSVFLLRWLYLLTTFLSHLFFWINLLLMMHINIFFKDHKYKGNSIDFALLGPVSNFSNQFFDFTSCCNITFNIQYILILFSSHNFENSFDVCVF